jgi:hypothetical protein
MQCSSGLGCPSTLGWLGGIGIVLSALWHLEYKAYLYTCIYYYHTLDGSITPSELDAQLFADHVGERGAVAQIYPIPFATALFLVHRFARDDPVEALRSGDGRAEPYLLVRGLLVEHICVVLGLYVDFEDTGLATR